MLVVCQDVIASHTNFCQSCEYLCTFLVHSLALCLSRLTTATISCLWCGWHLVKVDCFIFLSSAWLGFIRTRKKIWKKKSCAFYNKAPHFSLLIVLRGAGCSGFFLPVPFASSFSLRADLCLSSAAPLFFCIHLQALLANARRRDAS